jgi:polysaccharide biosynthesis/export protein
MKLILLLRLCAPLATTQGREVFSAETAANLPARKMGQRDPIAVLAYGLPGLSHSIQGEGMRPNELENTVGTAQEEAGLRVAPVVTVSVAECGDRPIRVAGAVRNPLIFQASSPVTLLEAITRAGGLTAAAGPEILVSKTQTGPDGQPTWLIERVSVQALIEGMDADANMVLSGGEEVRVPGASRVVVVGNVKRPGAFVVRDGAESSVLKMLSLAEGLAPNAGRQAYIFRREASEGKNEIRIELFKIMGRNAPDVTLLANDILYVTDSRTRRLGRTILEKLVLFGGTAGATAPRP